MLNENIRNLRKAKGLTQEELASRPHVVRQTVSKREKGLSVPDADTLQKLADELNVEIDHLLGGSINCSEAKTPKEAASENEITKQLIAINNELAEKIAAIKRF